MTRKFGKRKGEKDIAQTNSPDPLHFSKMIPLVCSNNNTSAVAGKEEARMSEFGEYQEFHGLPYSVEQVGGGQYQPATSEEMFDTSEGEGSVDSLNAVFSLAGSQYPQYSPTAQYSSTVYYDSPMPSYDSQYSDSLQFSGEGGGAAGQPAPAAPPGKQQQQGGARKGKGGRKKNLHPPTPVVLKHRRNMANARERRRMNGLNDAFERLREVVPNVNSEQKMSKIETLLVAQTYIKALAKLMAEVDTEPAEPSPAQSGDQHQ